MSAPDEDRALFNGSTSGSRFEGKLPKDGEYTVRVCLMRNAALRGETSARTITFSMGGDAEAGAGGGPLLLTP